MKKYVREIASKTNRKEKQKPKRKEENLFYGMFLKDGKQKKV